MRALMHSVFLLLFSVLQPTWLNGIEIFGTKPNLFLIYIIVVCCFCGRTEGATVGLVFGFVLDMLIGRLWGMNALLGMLSGFFIAHFCKKVLRNSNFLVAMIFVLVMSLFYEVVYYFIAFLTVDNVHFGAMFVKSILPECVYNVIISLPVYFIINKFSKSLYTDKGDAIG
ncbi:MAG: rod shape-determining protein MreD [Clostridia bacterium]|nr:rod shape-determining protein MreD [Oscillospiraceae bacterium]MBQ7959979.1 rod shape-determining protein MreD [Clostridia bacterium]